MVCGRTLYAWLLELQLPPPPPVVLKYEWNQSWVDPVVFKLNEFDRIYQLEKVNSTDGSWKINIDWDRNGPMVILEKDGERIHMPHHDYEYDDGSTSEGFFEFIHKQEACKLTFRLVR